MAAQPIVIEDNFVAPPGWVRHFYTIVGNNFHCNAPLLPGQSCTYKCPVTTKNFNLKSHLECKLHQITAEHPAVRARVEAAQAAEAAANIQNAVSVATPKQLEANRRRQLVALHFASTYASHLCTWKRMNFARSPEHF